MKKIFLFMFVMAAFIGFVYSQSISVTNPVAGNSLVKASTVIITWNAVGTTNGFKITLWKDGALSTIIEPNFSAGNGNRTYSWTVPETCGTGYQIKVKEKSNPVAGISGNFNITGCLRVLIPEIHLLQDLEIKDIRYVFNRGGWIVARVKSNVNPFRGDVVFGLFFPEVRRDGNQRVTKLVDIPRGAERDIYIWQKNSNSFSKDGLLISVDVDNGRSIEETDERNNSMRKRITIYDLNFAESPRRSLSLKRMYGKGVEDYRLEFNIKIKHNFVNTLRNVPVAYSISGHGMIARIGKSNFTDTFSIIRTGETVSLHVNKTFGKESRAGSKRPRFKKGETYTVNIVIDPSDGFKETNERNNSSSFSFKVTK